MVFSQERPKKEKIFVKITRKRQNFKKNQTKRLVNLYIYYIISRTEALKRKGEIMTLENVQGIVNLINIGLIAFFAISMVARLIWGLRRGFLKSLVRAAGTIAALITAFATFSLAFEILNPFVSEKLTEFLLSQEGGADIAALENSMAVLLVFIESLAGPLIFWALFLAWNAVFSLVSLIVRMILKIIPIKAGGLSRILGAAISVATGIVVFAMGVAPFAGYIKEIPDLYAEIVAAEIVPNDEEVNSTVNSVCEEGFFMSGIVGEITSPIFKFSSEVTYDGEKVNGIEETKKVLKIVPDVKKLGELDFADLENIDTAPIDALADKVGESSVLKTVVSEFMATAGTKWKNGEVFLGINIKEEIETSNPGYGNMLDGALQKLSTATKDNVVMVTKEFTSAIKSAGKMISYLNSLQSATEVGDMDNLTNDLADVMKGLDESTVEMIIPAISSDLLKDTGLGEKEAELASEVLKTTLTSVASMSDEEIDAEAKAINTVLSYASSDVTPEANDVIDALVSSELVLPAAKTVIDSQEGSSEVLGSVSEEQKTAISNAIDDYKAENPDADEEKLDIIKSLFGISG